MDAKAKAVAWLHTGNDGCTLKVHEGFPGAYPVIPLTDHEAALAEQRGSHSVLQECYDELLTAHKTLRSGLEALAGVYAEQSEYHTKHANNKDWADWYRYEHRAKAAIYHKVSTEIRTLTNSAKEETKC